MGDIRLVLVPDPVAEWATQELARDHLPCVLGCLLDALGEQAYREAAASRLRVVICSNPLVASMESDLRAFAAAHPRGLRG